MDRRQTRDRKNYQFSEERSKALRLIKGNSVSARHQKQKKDKELKPKIKNNKFPTPFPLSAENQRRS